MSNKIKFNVLVRAQDSDEKTDIHNINRFRPEPEDLEKCYYWLADKGVTCYKTEFGLACSASRQLFESIFSTQVEPLKHRPGKPAWQLLNNPKPPAEIADFITEISLSVSPELF